MFVDGNIDKDLTLSKKELARFLEKKFKLLVVGILILKQQTK